MRGFHPPEGLLGSGLFLDRLMGRVRGPRNPLGRKSALEWSETLRKGIGVGSKTLSFLSLFLGASLYFFPCEAVLVYFLSVFPFFLGVRWGQNILAFWGVVFLAFFKEGNFEGKEREGIVGGDAMVA